MITFLIVTTVVSIMPGVGPVAFLAGRAAAHFAVRAAVRYGAKEVAKLTAKKALSSAVIGAVAATALSLGSGGASTGDGVESTGQEQSAGVEESEMIVASWDLELMDQGNVHVVFDDGKRLITVKSLGQDPDWKAVVHELRRWAGEGRRGLRIDLRNYPGLPAHRRLKKIAATHGFQVEEVE